MTDTTLDIERLLDETFVARAEHHPTLGSTNDRARQCALEGASELPLLIVADRQTSGRGRGTRRWWTGRGSLAFSLLLDGDSTGVARSGSSLVALAAALAIVEAVEPLLRGQAVGLHWPNDVFAAGRKLAGILVETLADQRHIVGIGLNANNSIADAPPQLQQTATTLLDLTGVPHDRTTILLTVLKHLEGTLRLLSSARHEIVKRADAICLQRGQTLTIQSGDCSIMGRAAGIAPDGALLLDTPTGRRQFHSGLLRQFGD